MIPGSQSCDAVIIWSHWLIKAISKLLWFCYFLINIFLVDPCERFDCGLNARCKLYPPTGEPFCEPSCSLNNGGCVANQKCSLKEVQCVRSPCPPVVECTHTGPCKVCKSEQTCILEPLQCLIPPCPEIPRCLEPRCTLKADPGPCEAAIPRYFYNTGTRRCERFIFGGCLGNENNFETLEECEKTCDGEKSY